MGGFAGSHHNAVARLEAEGHAKLVCTCDPHAASFAKEQETWRLAQRGVGVFPDYRAMLDACHRGLDLVVVPTPINLHAEMHAAATALAIAKGVGIGTSAHAVGTSKALQMGEVEGAMSGLSIAVAGVLTAVLCPVFVNLID